MALPGSERDRMGDSQADRQSDSQTSWKPARQTWVSLQKELATWRGANWSQPRGKSSGKRILWKSTIGRQLSAAAAQEEEAIAETGETTLLKQRKQWPKKLKDANEQTRAAKVGSINRRFAQRQRGNRDGDGNKRRRILWKHYIISSRTGEDIVPRRFSSLFSRSVCLSLPDSWQWNAAGKIFAKI